MRAAQIGVVGPQQCPAQEDRYLFEDHNIPIDTIMELDAMIAMLNLVARSDWTDMVVANLETFAPAIEGESSYPFTAEEMVDNIEVLEAIAASAERGETVHLIS